MHLIYHGTSFSLCSLPKCIVTQSVYPFWAMWLEGKPLLPHRVHFCHHHFLTSMLWVRYWEGIWATQQVRDCGLVSIVRPGRWEVRSLSGHLSYFCCEERAWAEQLIKKKKGFNSRLMASEDQSPWSSWQRAWQQADSPDVNTIAEGLPSLSEGRRPLVKGKEKGETVYLSKPQIPPPVTSLS